MTDEPVLQAPHTKDISAPVEDALSGEQLADLMLEGSKPFQTLMASAKDLNLSPEVTRRLVQRIRAQYQPVLTELRKFQKDEFLGLLEDRAHRALEYMDDYNLAKANAKDLAIIVGILMEKRQLLRGEPTQILSIEERAGMSELIPRLLQEAERRGLQVGVYKTINGEAEVVTNPPDTERATRPRSVSKAYGPEMHIRGEVRKKAETGEPS